MNFFCAGRDLKTASGVWRYDVMGNGAQATVGDGQERTDDTTIMDGRDEQAREREKQRIKMQDVPIPLGLAAGKGRGGDVQRRRGGVGIVVADE